MSALWPHAASISMTSRCVDRLGAEPLPGGQREHGHALDAGARAGETSASARRSRSRRAARPNRAPPRAGSARPPRGSRGGASRRRRRRCRALSDRARRSSAARGRRGRRCGARRRARAAAAKFSAASRSRSANGEPARGRALHRVDQVIGDLDARRAPARDPLPVSASPATTSSASRVPLGRPLRAGERLCARARARAPSARTVCRSAHSRATSSEPAKPLAPVTRTRIAGR